MDQKGFTPVVSLVGILVLALVFGSGYYLGIGKNTESVQNQQNRLESQISAKTSSNDLLIVNSHSSFGDKRDSYFTFQIRFPAKYFVTSDKMISYYKTQGGIAPPRIILTTDSQSLSKDSDEDQSYFRKYKDIEESGRDCIMVWSTSGLSSLDGWYNASGESYQVLSEERIRIGKHDVIKRKVKNKAGSNELTQAFIQLPEQVSYVFNTCNMNSEKDLDIILRNFDTRGSI